jgi:hypothetical protein
MSTLSSRCFPILAPLSSCLIPYHKRNYVLQSLHKTVYKKCVPQFLPNVPQPTTTTITSFFSLPEQEETPIHLNSTTSDLATVLLKRYMIPRCQATPATAAHLAQPLPIVSKQESNTGLRRGHPMLPETLSPISTYQQTRRRPQQLTTK